jgi:hypothetical protein
MALEGMGDRGTPPARGRGPEAVREAGELAGASSQGSAVASDWAPVTGTSGELAQKMVYCLRKVGLIDLVGKRGRANLYGLAQAGRGNA